MRQRAHKVPLRLQALPSQRTCTLRGALTRIPPTTDAWTATMIASLYHKADTVVQATLVAG